MLLLEDAAGDQQQALEQLPRRWSRSTPILPTPRSSSPTSCSNRGQLDEALAQLKAAAAAIPIRSPSRSTLGYTQRLRGQNEEAQRLRPRR